MPEPAGGARAFRGTCYTWFLHTTSAGLTVRGGAYLNYLALPRVTKHGTSLNPIHDPMARTDKRDTETHRRLRHSPTQTHLQTLPFN